MNVQKDITVFIDFLEFKRVSIDFDQVKQDLISHPDFPSIFSYNDVLIKNDVENHVFRISFNEVFKLNKSFIAFIQGQSDPLILVHLKRKGDFFQLKKERGEIISLNKKELEAKWLGLVMILDDNLEFIEKLSFSDNNIGNIDMENNRVIGFNNNIRCEGKYTNCSIDVIGNNNTIVIKKEAELLMSRLVFRGNDNYLEIGNNSRVKGNFNLEGSNSEIIIGSQTTIEYANFSATESKKIEIGEDCMFSDNISIRTSDSHSIIDNITNLRINPSKDVIIGNHVWIGSEVKILKGVTIGDESIIGLGTIVTKNVPNNSIVAGIPGKIIRENISWNRDLI
ncbi:acyltransferase [uncultured Aquimarina sp.]|uniref:acyltransferase n=1 Tax=uncultured Aquimarina sp. TaxID=575652 RepID=UPI002626AD27|nr:acyltransferase [uncultured Aquimarina sp.]